MLTTQKVAVTNPYVSKVAELSGAPYFHSRWFYILWHSFFFFTPNVLHDTNPTLIQPCDQQKEQTSCSNRVCVSSWSQSQLTMLLANYASKSPLAIGFGGL